MNKLKLAVGVVVGVLEGVDVGEFVLIVGLGVAVGIGVVASTTRISLHSSGSQITEPEPRTSSPVISSSIDHEISEGYRPPQATGSYAPGTKHKVLDSLHPDSRVNLMKEHTTTKFRGFSVNSVL